MNFQKIAEENKILEIKVGSHLYGTNTPNSDLDFAGVFMPTEEMVYGFQVCEEVNLGTVSKDASGRNTANAVDRVLYEYRKFVKLALQNNPNILEILFVNEDKIVFANDFGKRLLSKAELFPHKGAHHRFVKYADSQRHKMQIRPENYAKLEEGLEILQKESGDKVLAELKDTPPFVYEGKGRHIKLGDLSFETSVFVKKARKMVEDRLSKATNRVQLFTKYGYDVKHACNLIRLLLEGIELMNTGRIVMPLAYREEISKVKNGGYSAEQVMKRADELVEEARVAYEKSKLPTEPRAKEIEEFLIREVRLFDRGILPDESNSLPFGERYERFLGVTEGLPSDLASQHEHYRLGKPKRSTPGLRELKLAQLSPETLEARKPQPPEELVGALQDRVHLNAGVSRPGHAVKIKKCRDQRRLDLESCKVENGKKISKILGKILTVARYVVGGDNNGSISAANVHTISRRCNELKNLLDQYEKLMIERVKP